MSLLEVLVALIAFLLFLILVGVFLLLRNSKIWMEAFTDEFRKRARNKYSDIDERMADDDFRGVLAAVADHRANGDSSSSLDFYEGIANYRLENWEASRELLEKALEASPSYEDSLMPYIERLREKTA